MANRLGGATSRRHVFLDFDGPVCSVFRRLTAADVAARVLRVLAEHGHPGVAGECAPHDPLDLLEHAATRLPGLVGVVEETVRGGEVDAVRLAEPTPGAADLIRACRSSGRSLAIVSNNAVDAVTTYLTDHDLLGYVDTIAARRPDDAAHLKPDPRLLHRAAEALDARPDGCVMIGDSPSDVHAASAFGAPAIGYAKKPGTRRALIRAGAVAVVDHLGEITREL